MFASKATSKGHPATVGAMISAVLGKTSSIHDMRAKAKERD